MIGRQLGGDRLAHDQRTGLAQEGNRDGIATRPASGEGGSAQFGRHVSGVDDVLHPNRHTVKRPARLARVAGTCLSECQFRIQKRPGMDRILTRGDPSQA